MSLVEVFTFLEPESLYPQSQEFVEGLYFLGRSLGGVVSGTTIFLSCLSHVLYIERTQYHILPID